MPSAPPRSAALLLLAALVLPAAARAQTDEPEADEYAVWSAAMGHLHGRDTRRLVVEDTTFVPRGRPEIDRGMLAFLGTPAVVLDSLDARSRRSVQIDRTRLRAGRARVLGSEEWKEPMPRIRVSRVAFDESRTRALVHVAMTCGALCGSRGVLEMRRDERGRWRFVRHLTLSFS